MGTANYPTDEELRQSLAEAGFLGADDAGTIMISHREPNIYASSFEAEVVDVRVRGQAHKLLIKYDRHKFNGELHTRHEKRGGHHFEAMIYREILSRISVTLPRYYGDLHFRKMTAFAIEFIEGSLRLYASPVENMFVAARWLGAFHRLVGAQTCEWVPRMHDRPYYESWSRRVLEFCGPVADQYPWLKAFCELWERDIIDLLLSDDQVLIHGEFYPKNILARHGEVYPVDWEGASVGSGVLDLTCLTESWPEDVFRGCLDAYGAVRWPGSPSRYDERMIDAGRCFWNLRWLGDRPEWTTTEKHGWRFKVLGDLAAKRGIDTAASPS